MKKAYVSPELDLVRFEAEDVIATSDMTFDEFQDRCQQVDREPQTTADCPEVYTCYVFE